MQMATVVSSGHDQRLLLLFGTKRVECAGRGHHNRFHLVGFLPFHLLLPERSRSACRSASGHFGIQPLLGGGTSQKHTGLLLLLLLLLLFVLPSDE
jgi:hypothetical protein